MGTQFTEIYNRFLGKITDDMYMELTPEDTIKDLRNLLTNAIPEFEFPRCNLDDYTVETLVIREDEAQADRDFIIGVVWNKVPGDEDTEIPDVLVERSYFETELSSEEINILATLMMINWVQRQVTSIENTRMKYSGSDFKMTSQANHLAKLLSLLSETQRQSHHLQRLYKRRIKDKDGKYHSNWNNAIGRGNTYFSPDFEKPEETSILYPQFRNTKNNG